jgi:alkylation response protein AidB-like acyl-CoA dehydrogenase
MSSPLEPAPSDEERQMLRDAVRGFLATHWSLTDAKDWPAKPEDFAIFWRDITAQGLIDLGTDPADGGMRELLIVAEELGRAACPIPFLANAAANILSARLREQHVGCSPLDRLLSRQPILCLAFGEFDPDRNAGHAVATNGKVSGQLHFVEGAALATHCLICLGGEPSVAIVALNAPGVRITATRSLGENGLYEIALANAPADFVEVPEALVYDLNLVARLGLAARAYGAARRSFEMVVEYGKERRQFGQPIGRFQAVQHKLANCLIALEGVRLTLHNAASCYDLRAAHWRYFASAAFAFASGALRQVSLETHHTWGAIGYADEHEAPRHFRRVHGDVVRHGGVSRARVEIADSLLRAGGGLPKYDLGDAGNAFRTEVHDWLRDYWSEQRKSAWDSRPYDQRDFDPEFARALGKTGWIGMSWPKEYGGQQRSPLERLALLEEMEAIDAPRAGAEIQAVALMQFGTDSQKREFLPEILAGETMFGMGYSEPNAGSDLASLRTTAVREGDGWIINGQKIWTTTWWAKYMFLAARTNPDVNLRHRGIGIFIVPMNTPGISVNPARTMYDGTFANIFYDNVRVPADALVGDVDRGWEVLTSALSTERGLVGGGIVIKAAHIFDLLCETIKTTPVDGQPLSEDPVVRDRMAALAAEIEVGRQLMLHCASEAGGPTKPADAAISKVFSGELLERLGEAALDILGMLGTLSEGAPGAVCRGKLEHSLRHSLMWVISIGTNEIQRSIIAQQGLGLPR